MKLQEKSPGLAYSQPDGHRKILLEKFWSCTVLYVNQGGLQGVSRGKESHTDLRMVNGAFEESN